MTRLSAVIAPALGLALLATGCGGDRDRDMMGAGPWGGMSGAALLSVTPAGGTSGVPASTSIVLRFEPPMGFGMERYLDLHVGDLEGPTVPMTCGWSGDRTTLTCLPNAPLASRTTYMIHLGGGLTTQAGQPLDCGRYGPGTGGWWVTRRLLGRSHGGGPWGAMPPGWRGADGGYGMAFSFTTS